MAVVSGIILNRLKVPAIIGYIVTGILATYIFGFNLEDSGDLREAADLGIVFLMFMIGLDFSFKKITQMKQEVLLFGGLQIGLSIAAFFSICHFFQFDDFILFLSTNVEELQNIMEKINDKINCQINETTNMPPISLFNIEKEYLNALPKQDILDHYIDNKIPAKVSNESLVYYKGTKYSVPPKYINQTLKLKEIDNKLQIYYNTTLVTIHEITNQKIQYHNQDYIECLRYSMPYKDDDELARMAEKNLKLLSRLTKERKDDNNEM